MYGIVSDLHFHRWSAFSKVNNDGVNSRLRIILNELLSAAEYIKSNKGDTMYVAGDIFHVRGSVAPAVLNPVVATFSVIKKMGLDIIAIPGNHDLESNDSEWLSNASQALEGSGVEICFESTVYADRKMVMVPWFNTISELRCQIEHMQKIIKKEGAKVEDFDMIIHAPVDDVIIGIPDHGLSAELLASFGFKRVFAGHYHNFKDFGNRVYSVGATTHQTWNCVNTKAGFLTVTDEGVEHHESSAPKFVDLEDIQATPKLIKGNYIRAKISIVNESEVTELREWLEKKGAAGHVIHPVKDAPLVNRDISVDTQKPIEASVVDYIGAKKYKKPAQLKKLCAGILSEAAEVVVE